MKARRRDTTRDEEDQEPLLSEMTTKSEIDPYYSVRE